MRTSIYINNRYPEKLKAASLILCISKNEIISILISRITNDSVFKSKVYQTVKYQSSYPDIVWKTQHIKFDPVFYEKAIDSRRNFKFSVSWFIAYAIVNYLDEIVKEMTDPENKGNMQDNYDHNFVYIAKTFGGIRGFITIYGVPEEKHLKNLLM